MLLQVRWRPPASPHCLPLHTTCYQRAVLASSLPIPLRRRGMGACPWQNALRAPGNNARTQTRIVHLAALNNTSTRSVAGQAWRASWQQPLAFYQQAGIGRRDEPRMYASLLYRLSGRLKSRAKRYRSKAV